MCEILSVCFSLAAAAAAGICCLPGKGVGWRLLGFGTDFWPWVPFRPTCPWQGIGPTLWLEGVAKRGRFAKKSIPTEYYLKITKREEDRITSFSPHLYHSGDFLRFIIENCLEGGWRSPQKGGGGGVGLSSITFLPSPPQGPLPTLNAPSLYCPRKS